MPAVRDWKEMREMSERLLRERTGEDLATWNRKVLRSGVDSPERLREWLRDQGVSGYAQSLVVMERFGYPDFFTATADELVDAQYVDRPHLRPIYDRIQAELDGWEGVSVQARKTYVSLTTERRTFARVQATTRQRVDLALRVEGVAVGRRWKKATVHESMQVQVGLGSVKEFDSEVRAALKKACEQSR